MKEYNFEEFQGVDSKGRYVKVSELSEQEAKNCLCQMYEIMEKLEESISATSEIIDKWWQ